jgi:hypothetical protein
MRAWLCIFFAHRWMHIRAGLYQCTRCKTISPGFDRDTPPVTPQGSKP